MPYQCLKWIDMPKWSAAFLWANFRVASLSSSVASPGRCWNLLPSAGDFFEIHQTASSLLLWPHCDFHYKLYEGKNFDNTPSWRQKEKIGKNGKLRKSNKMDLQHKRFLLPSCWVKLSPRDMCMASLGVNKSSPPPQRQRWQAHAQPMTIYYYYWLSFKIISQTINAINFYQYHHHYLLNYYSSLASLVFKGWPFPWREMFQGPARPPVTEERADLWETPEGQSESSPEIEKNDETW